MADRKTKVHMLKVIGNGVPMHGAICKNASLFNPHLTSDKARVTCTNCLRIINTKEQS